MTTQTHPTLSKTQVSGLVLGVYAALFVMNGIVALIALT